MPDKRPVLLMTRPQAGSERFAAAFAGVMEAVISPLLRIEPVAGAIPWGDARGVIFTSANAVEIVAGQDAPRDLPAWCVGERTTDAARAAGWRAECAGRDADALVATLSAAPPPAPLLHLRGAHTRGQIAERLGAAGIGVAQHVIYNQQLCPLSPAAQGVLASDQRVIVPLFSPRTATHFAATTQPRAGLILAAMSAAVAKPLEDKGFTGLHIARTPDEPAMRTLVAALAEAPPSG